MADANSGPNCRRKPPPLKRTQKEAGPLTTQTRDEAAETDPIGLFARRSLQEEGIDPDGFAWVVPLSSMTMQTGRQLEGGVLAASPSDHLHFFRYAPKEGFQLASVAKECAIPHASADDQGVTVDFTVTEAPLSSCTAQIDEAFLSTAKGAWFDFVGAAIAGALGLEVSTPVVVGAATLSVPCENELRAQTFYSCGATLLAVSGEEFRTLPQLPVPAGYELSAWNIEGSVLIALWLKQGRPLLLSLETTTPTAEFFCSQASEALKSRQREVGLSLRLRDTLGQFAVARTEPGEESGTVILQLWDNSLRKFAHPDSPSYSHAAVLGDVTALANPDGQMLMLAVPQQQGQALAKQVEPVEALVETKEGNEWGIATKDGHPVRIEIQPDTFVLGKTTVPVNLMGEIRVEKTAENLCTVQADWGENNSLQLSMHPQAAFRLWEEWDARRVATAIVNAGTNELYAQFNHAKKHNLLLVMFGDVVLLNRALDSGISMEKLLTRMQDVGAVKFAEDDTLRNATVEKILLLTSTLTMIKQRFELLATMAPYYWAQEESRWLSSVFGQTAVRSVVASERRRIVPLVRRRIRVAQSDMLRSMAQIEAAARPLEAIFAREEIQKHWSSRVRQYLPAAVQGTIGAGLIFFGGGQGAIMGLRMVGGAMATHGLGSILGVFQKDREAAAQVRRAAETIFPWWEIFMRTLVVSIFEAAEFIDQENVLCMKRDRRLLDSTGEKRDAYAVRLEKLLRKRIVDERRNQFSEILEGSGVRLAEVIGDIEKAIDTDMRQGVNEFVRNLAVAGKKDNTLETAL